MSRRHTPRYVVKISQEQSDIPSGMVWHHEDGKPTAANLEKKLVATIRSFGPKGVNAHVGKAIAQRFERPPILPRMAIIWDQIENREVAVWKHPPFFAY